MCAHFEKAWLLLEVILSLNIEYGSVLGLSSLTLLSSQQYQPYASKGITCQSGVFGRTY